MTRLLLIPCLVIALAALPLTGCGGGGGAEPAPAPDDGGSGGGGGGGGGSSGLSGRDASAGTTSGGAGGGSSTWLGRINQFRSWAGLAPVSEDAALAAACVSHSTYMVKEDSLTHAENVGSPWYTAAGDAAGQSSNVMVSSAVPGDLSTAWTGPLRAWMSGPFHGIGMISPGLTQTAYGQYAEAIGSWRFGATLDVITHLGGTIGSLPVMWPGHGATTDILSYDGGESPDPLLGTGWTAPTGAPIYLQVSPSVGGVNVTASSLMAGSASLAHITFDGTNYGAPGSLGRNILQSRNAIVLMPRNPLTPGTLYSVAITNDGTLYEWSFLTHTLATKPVPGSQKFR